MKKRFFFFGFNLFCCAIPLFHSYFAFCFCCVTLHRLVPNAMNVIFYLKLCFFFLTTIYECIRKVLRNEKQNNKYFYWNEIHKTKNTYTWWRRRKKRFSIQIFYSIFSDFDNNEFLLWFFFYYTSFLNFFELISK